MTLPEEFALERWFARWEFNARHLVSSSDCEPYTVGQLLALAAASPEALLDLKLSYRESEGDPELRSRIARFYPGLGAGDVMVAAPEEAIYLFMHALVSPGDRVVVQTPCYQSLSELPRSLGCEVIEWPMVEDGASWRVDLDRLAGLAKGARMIVVNAPHNPTGWLPSQTEMDAIAAVAQREGAWLFVDEMYRGLEQGPAQRLRPAACDGERTVSLWGMSKAFGLPGTRIGWLALRDRALRQRMLQLKDYTTICASGPSELLAGVALDVAEQIFARNRAIIDGNLAAAREWAGDGWREPRAGSVALARLPDGVSAQAFAEDAAERRGVMFVPSTVFGWGDAHVRLGLGRLGFVEGLEALRTPAPSVVTQR